MKQHLGRAVALAQSAGICINTIKFSCLPCSQAFPIAAPRMLQEYQFSVDHSPDMKRYMARCARGRLASTVQALHEVTAKGLQSFSSPSAR